MPATAVPSGAPIRGNTKALDVPYRVTGAATILEALNAMFAVAPAAVDGRFLSTNDSSAEEVDVRTGEWNVIGRYTTSDFSFNSQPENTFTVQIDFATTTQRILQSRKTVDAKTRPGFMQRNFRGAIGVQADGSIEGCEILATAPTFEFQRVFGPTWMDDGTYYTKLKRIVGRVNTGSFFGLSAGEGLLTRVTGGKRADGKWVLKYSVAISENELYDAGDTVNFPGLTIPEGAVYPDGIFNINKPGWDYLWIYYQDLRMDDGGPSQYTGRVPVNAFVEQVYRRADFDDLDIESGTEI